ncbi:histidine--tRNA ligase [Candidatus Woesearchaeota archaeon]|nr:MAG: histidine--tRNA ligase [Candidatus Woesearchaeota archaeon]
MLIEIGDNMKLQTAKGVRDFGPEEKIVRNEVVSKLTRIFERYGFSPLETPIIERYDVLSAKGGAGNESDALQEAFTFEDRGKRKLGLRFELTLSLARFVGMNPQLKMPFKRYQIGEVFRDGPIKLGRYREFWQCDVDTVGVKDVVADAELISLSLDVFKELGFDAYLEVNNRKILTGMIEFAGIPKSKAESVMISLDKIKKLGENEVRKELEEKGINDEQIAKLLSSFKVSGTNEDKLETLKGILKSDTAKEGINEIERVFSFLSSSQKKNVVFNPALARGLGYYTGTVFEGFLRKSEITSSVCGGGRYDKMIGSLLSSNSDTPAVGISFGLEVITDTLRLSKKSVKKCVTKVYVIPIGTQEESMKLVKEIRDNGINADIDLIGRGISKNLNFANSMGIPYVVFVGEDELKQKKFKLRNMESGKEELLPKDRLIEKLK